MYMPGSASEQNKSRGKGIARFLFRRKPIPISRILVEQRRLLFFSQLVVMGVLAFSRFKPPFARAPDHFFSLTPAVVPNKVVQKCLNVAYIHF